MPRAASRRLASTIPSGIASARAAACCRRASTGSLPRLNCARHFASTTSIARCLPEAYPVSSRTGAPHGGRTNGTYHAAELHRERQRRTRLLIVIGGLVALISVVNVALTNADMTRIEQSGPERLALAGGGFEHFV